MQRAKIINVNIEKSNSGLFRATSPDMSGIHVAASTVQQVQDMAKAMISDLYEERGELVDVFEVEDVASTSTVPCVVVPRERRSASC